MPEHEQPEQTAPASEPISVRCREILQLMVEDEADPSLYVGVTVDLDWWLKANNVSKQMFWRGLADHARPRLLEMRAEKAAALAAHAAAADEAVTEPASIPEQHTHEDPPPPADPKPKRALRRRAPAAPAA